MSEDVKCECCPMVGRRKRGELAPPFGWYAELAVDGEPCIFWVCSNVCRELAVVWKAGPGVLDLSKCPKCNRPLGTNRPIECACGFNPDADDEREEDDMLVTAQERACLNGAHEPEEEHGDGAVEVFAHERLAHLGESVSKDVPVLWHRDLRLPLKLCKHCRNICVPRG